MTLRPRPALSRALLATVSTLALGLVAQPAIAQQVISIRVGPGEGSPYVQPYNPGYPYGPVRVNVAPPAPLVDIRPASVATGSGTWIPGAWNWNGAGYAWTAGHWSTPPSSGATWIPPRWERREGYVLYYPGYWSPATVIDPGITPPPYNTYTNALGIGSSAAGQFISGMPTTSNGALYNDFTITLYAGQTVTFVLHGGSSWSEPGGRIDPVLQLFGGGRLLVEDDDGNGNLDSRIVFTPQYTGTYVLRATTYGYGIHQGTFTLVSRYGAAGYDM